MNKETKISQNFDIVLECASDKSDLIHTHLSHHAAEHAVEGEEEAPLAARGRHLVDDQDDEAAGGGAQHGREDGRGDRVGVPVGRHGQLIKKIRIQLELSLMFGSSRKKVSDM